MHLLTLGHHKAYILCSCILRSHQMVYKTHLDFRSEFHDSNEVSLFHTDCHFLKTDIALLPFLKENISEVNFPQGQIVNPVFGMLADVRILNQLVSNVEILSYFNLSFSTSNNKGKFCVFCSPPVRFW